MTKKTPAGSPKRLCECGCGQYFRPARRWQRFLNAQHRWNAWYRGHKETRSTTADLRARIERLEEQFLGEEKKPKKTK